MLITRMKRILIPSVLTLLLCACGGKPPAETDTAPLKVSPASQSVVALGEMKSFTVVSATDWYARSSAAWAKVQTASGKASATGTTMVVNCEENHALEARTATITVSNLGKETVEVTIDQAAGDGTTPTVKRGIATVEDLLGFAKAVNGEGGSIAQYLVDGAVKLLNDIDCSSITEWIPAGTAQMPLTYNINGNNRVLKNVYWTVDLEKYPDAGFIGCARGVTIDKLTFGNEGSQVTFTGAPAGKVRAGGIVGAAEGVTMTKVVNNASLTVSSTSATSDNLIIGGIAG